MEVDCPFCRRRALIEEHANEFRCTLCPDAGARQRVPGRISTCIVLSVGLLVVPAVAFLSPGSGEDGFGGTATLGGIEAASVPAAPETFLRAAAEDALVQAPASEDAELVRHYTWDYQDTTHTLDLHIPLPLLELYDRTDFTYRNGRHNYAAYVANQYDDETIRSIADGLTRLADEAGLHAYDRVSYALAFVQSLAYTSDNVTTGYDDFPRYPIQTLAERGGDCEDTAILFAAIVQAMGHDAVLLEVPGHMAAGVHVADGFHGTTHAYDGRSWAYAETTGDAWAIGQVPEVYQGKQAQVHALVPQAVLVIDDARVSGQGGVGGVTVTVDIANDGMAAGSGGTATVYGLSANGTIFYDSDQCTFGPLAAGATHTCDLVLRNDPRIASYTVRVRDDDGLSAERVL